MRNHSWQSKSWNVSSTKYQVWQYHEVHPVKQCDPIEVLVLQNLKVDNGNLT